MHDIFPPQRMKTKQTKELTRSRYSYDGQSRFPLTWLSQWEYVEQRGRVSRKPDLFFGVALID